VLLEALASGKPVVASNVGAIGEVLDKSCGFLVDVKKGEAEEFAQRIQTLLEDPGLRETMGENGRRKVEADYDRAQSRRMYRELFG
jgi:glycosyltransferase involved in cell wall biosynthesis